MAFYATEHFFGIFVEEKDVIAGVGNAHVEDLE